MNNIFLAELQEEISQKLPNYTVSLFTQTRQHKWEKGTYISITRLGLEKNRILADISLDLKGTLKIYTYLQEIKGEFHWKDSTHLLADPATNLQEIVTKLVSDITKWEKKI